jgi:hypothetical protein
LNMVEVEFRIPQEVRVCSTHLHCVVLLCTRWSTVCPVCIGPTCHCGLTKKELWWECNPNLALVL